MLNRELTLAKKRDKSDSVAYYNICYITNEGNARIIFERFRTKRTVSSCLRKILNSRSI